MRVFTGAIVTCDAKGAVFRYLVERNGKIAHVGNELPEEYHGAERIDLGTKALLPSFGDSHLHFSSFAFFNAGLDVRRAGTIEEMKEILREHARQHGGKVVFGFGASPHNVVDKRLITRREMDEACATRAVFLVKYDGHACVLNSKMLEMLPRHIRDLRGYDEDSGEMRQEAFFATTDFVTSQVSTLAFVRNMLRGIDHMAERGIGLMHSVAGVGFPRDLDVDLERFVGRAQHSGYQTRIFFQTMEVDKVLARRLPRVGGCFATALDGCFGSEDAALLEPYHNDSTNRGVLYYADEEVIAFTKRANRAGLQIQMHAIGDAAFEQALRALEAALDDFPREDHRHGIIHASLPTERGLEKCAELGIQIPLQPAMLSWNLEPMEYLSSILGERAAVISPLRRMQDLGLQMTGGSDAPCTIPDPIGGLFGACNHFVPEQSLTIAEALRLFTYNVAWGAFDEDLYGSLEPGKMANMVILNHNPLEMEPSDLRQLAVEESLFAGEPYRCGMGVGGMVWHGLVGRGRKI